MQEKKEKTNVIIAENTLSYAELLASAINQTDDFRVAEIVDNGKILKQKLNDLKKGIILLDIHMPPYTDGLESAQQIHLENPNKFKIIFLSVVWVDYIEKLIKNNVVNGYVAKNSAMADILSALTTVRDGGTFVLRSDEHAENLEDTPENEIVKKYNITTQERKVLCLMVEGLTAKQIAYQLDIKFGTVEVHIRNMKRETKMNSRELIAFAIRNGLC